MMHTRNSQSAHRILVAGTTGDYIDLIARRHPGRALFLTDAAERAAAREPAPPAPDELLCDLSNTDETLSMLRAHLKKWDLNPDGIACFDCESMLLAARIAGEFSLPYPTPDAVAACRSKFVCKQLWRKAGLPCPETAIVNTAAEAAAFLARVARPTVLKPVAGSGSQYVFLCLNSNDCRAAFRVMESRMPALRADPLKPLYSRERPGGGGDYVMEEFVEGTEYSCDFALDGDRLEVIRIARKIPAAGRTFGVTLAYVLPSSLPPSIAPALFKDQVLQAARAIGLNRAIGMLDFIVRGDEALMLEMTPRPGGDCLPPLILRSSGLDMLGLALDFAGSRFPSLPAPSNWIPLAGLRLFAPSPGVIAGLDVEKMIADRRVLEYCLKSGQGARVVFPPDDYDSQILGYVIFKPNHQDSVEANCAEIAGLFGIRMEAP